MAKKHKNVQVLIKPASADCNLECKYCFYLKKAGLYPDTRVHRMSPEVQEELVRQLLRYGGPQPAFAYQGGEPTLMGLDYFQRSVDLQMHYGTGQTVANSIQTNGILIDDKWAYFLAKYRFLVGLSLDGPADIHDRFRIDKGGRPTHARVLQAARTMDEFGVEFNILSVMTKHSAGRAREIYQYYRSLGCDWLQFIPAVEFDPETGELAEWSPSGEEFGQFMCDIFDCWREDFVGGRPRVSVRLFDTLLAIHAGMSSPSCTFRQKCGIYVVVEHNGDVYSCDFFVEPQWKLGNLMDNSLRTLLEGAKQREFANLKADLPDDCKACEWLWMCHGGCTKDRMRSGRPGELGKDYFCEGYKMIFQHSNETFQDLAKIVQAEQSAAQNPNRQRRRRGNKAKR